LIFQLHLHIIFRFQGCISIINIINVFSINSKKLSHKFWVFYSILDDSLTDINWILRSNRFPISFGIDKRSKLMLISMTCPCEINIIWWMLWKRNSQSWFLPTLLHAGRAGLTFSALWLMSSSWSQYSIFNDVFLLIKSFFECLNFTINLLFDFLHFLYYRKDKHTFCFSELSLNLESNSSRVLSTFTKIGALFLFAIVKGKLSSIYLSSKVKRAFENSWSYLRYSF